MHFAQDCDPPCFLALPPRQIDRLGPNPPGNGIGRNTIGGSIPECPLATKLNRAFGERHYPLVGSRHGQHDKPAGLKPLLQFRGETIPTARRAGSGI